MEQCECGRHHHRKAYGCLASGGIPLAHSLDPLHTFDVVIVENWLKRLEIFLLANTISCNKTPFGRTNICFYYKKWSL
jgi:hypothetical protein